MGIIDQSVFYLQISKIFGRQTFQQITSYVSSFLSPYLCGFRKGHNAQYALLRLKNKLKIRLEKKENVGMFMMYLSIQGLCSPMLLWLLNYAHTALIKIG